MVQDGYAETLLKTLKRLAEQFAERDSDSWRANLMWSANQALNGLIGCGVPQDWATHMIGHEFTALWQVDHARSLAIVQPSLLRHQLTVKRAKLEQMGSRVFDLASGVDLAERTIDAIENFYHQLGIETTFSQYDTDREHAINRIIEQLDKHGMTALGEHQAIGLEQSREILQSAIV